MLSSLASREDSNNKTTVLTNNQEDGITSKNSTVPNNGTVARNNATTVGSNISLENSNSTKTSLNNSTVVNNKTQIVIPEACKDLTMIYSDDAEAHSHWWNTVHSLDGKSFYDHCFNSK